MAWNWEQEDWPNFGYDKDALVDIENQFLTQSGTLFGVFKHLSGEEQQTITVSLLSDEALKTSEIEGEFLDRESLQSSIRKQFGLQSETRKTPPSERGVAEMMVDLYENLDRPLEHQTLFQWHEMLLGGKRRSDATERTTVRCKSFQEPSTIRRCISRRRLPNRFPSK